MQALKNQVRHTGKSYSQLVREAIDNAYTSRFSADEIALMAKEAKEGKGIKKFKSLDAARHWLWSL